MLSGKKIVNEIEKNGVLGCVVNNYQDMSKEQLMIIFKEFFYVVNEYCGDEDELVYILREKWDIE